MSQDNTPNDGHEVLVVDSELTIYNVAQLRHDWLAAYARGVRHFDFSAVCEADAAGVQLIAALARMAQREGHALCLGSDSTVLNDALALIGASSLMSANAANGAGC